MESPDPASRYVTDTPYARRFVRELSPAWLDFTALICGHRPPARETGFAWCDLGCGHGVTPTLLAAMHPEGQFFGFDLLPAHAEFGRTLAADAGLANAHFEALDFAAAAERDLPGFDYIVAHGVYSWIDAGALADLHRFVARHLKPGGLLYLGYNCQPGWAADAPFQRLLLELSARGTGDSAARLAEAERSITAMIAAGASILQMGAVGKEWEALRQQLPPTYFIHEFLPPAWQPVYVTEVRRRMAALGLTPIGSATIRENIDAFTLDARAREIVAASEDADMRELMRDYFLQKRFRRDVFGRAVPRVEAAEIRRRLTESRYIISCPQPAPMHADSATAARILEVVASGAATLPPTPDVVTQIITLISSGRMWPVASGSTATIGRINAAIRKRIGGPDEIGFLVLPAGTAVELNPEQMAQFRDRGPGGVTLPESCGPHDA
jgi:SAM-dependent methyltransferase